MLLQPVRESMSGTEEVKEQSDEAALENTEKPMPSSQEEVVFTSNF